MSADEMNTNKNRKATTGEKAGEGHRPRHTQRLIPASLISLAVFALQWFF